MSHLLAMTVGPVQELIAAARRTRDLWLGSHLLSEISRAVAQSAETEGGSLIFPASLDQPNVANIVLVELPSGDPQVVAANARRAAQQRWRQIADPVRRQAAGEIRPEIWDDQIDDVIEFYAAWVSRSHDYPADRRRVMRLLAGRKNCRDFLPAKGRAGVPKSSLDGQRESVLKPPDQPTRRGGFRAQLRIRDGEQLDVLGLVKRMAEGHRPYPSVARIALDPWVRGNQHRLQPVMAACAQLEGQNILRRLDTSVYGQFKDFPYEGTAAYVSRHHELLEETRADAQDLRPLRDALAGLPQPEPYLAVLVADGDRMGAALARLPSADAHRKFSRDLAAFASEAQRVVNQHRGVLVYAGGDDVLAFLPVDTCLACARALHEAFGQRLHGYGALSLSVGVAIAHFMENLEDLLAYGRAAEKSAKEPDRDGLAVHLHKRGGAPIKVRQRWNTSPDARWTHYAQLLRAEAIPSKLPYDLRKLADLYAAWSDPATIQAAMQRDLLRVIRDKQPKAGRAYMGHVEQIVRGLSDVGALRALAEQLLVARQIASALKMAGAPLDLL